jgi:PAP2 superfamily C-terminal
MTPQALAGEYLRLIQTRGFLHSLGVGLALLAGSLGLNYAAHRYADAYQSNYVRDLLLDRLPVVNTTLILNEGMVAFTTAVAVMAAWFPARLPFLLKSTALFVAVRAVFISLTHLAVYPQHVVPDQGDLSELLAFLSSDGDLFFSAHTGLPLLMALVFWDRRRVRIGFLAVTALEGASVLLAHIHYSIDVLGALFITPTIFGLAERWFSHDRALACPRSVGATIRAEGTSRGRTQQADEPFGASSGTSRRLGATLGHIWEAKL